MDLSLWQLQIISNSSWPQAITWIMSRKAAFETLSYTDNYVFYQGVLTKSARRFTTQKVFFCDVAWLWLQYVNPMFWSKASNVHLLLSICWWGLSWVVSDRAAAAVCDLWSTLCTAPSWDLAGSKEYSTKKLCIKHQTLTTCWLLWQERSGFILQVWFERFLQTFWHFFYFEPESLLAFFHIRICPNLRVFPLFCRGLVLWPLPPVGEIIDQSSLSWWD